jgi:3D (Asp-Asp-Asp) domain-containing protein
VDSQGDELIEGTLACNDYPIGTKVIIEGKEYTVRDRMARDGRMDIFMPSRHDALRWGRQTKEVTIIE